MPGQTRSTINRSDVGWVSDLTGICDSGRVGDPPYFMRLCRAMFLAVEFLTVETLRSPRGLYRSMAVWRLPKPIDDGERARHIRAAPVDGLHNSQSVLDERR